MHKVDARSALTVEEKRNLYAQRVTEIKRKLAEYSNDSVLDIALTGLATAPQGTAIELLQSLPDLVFLLIKWKMLCPPTGVRKINGQQFHALKSDLFALQSFAAELDNSSPPFLALRTFIMPQVKWQRDGSDEIFALVRQRIWFTKDANSDYYEDIFRNRTGLSIRSYYEIAFVIMTCISSYTEEKTMLIKLCDLVTKLSPTISIEEVAAFVRLLSVTPSQLPAVFEPYRNDLCEAREYFQQSAFNLKPLILRDQSLQLVYKNLTRIALSTIVPELLKSIDGRTFKEKFGATMERYTEDLLIRNNVSFIDEKEIAEIYATNKITETKITDFIIEDEGRIFVESKAIEPNDFFTTCTEPAVLNRRLSESFVKAIFQAQACCDKVGKLDEFVSKPTYGLVILHQDFFFATGEKVERDVNPNLTEEIEKKYGDLPIPLKNIYYLPVHDLERLLASLPASGKTLTQFLNRAIENDERAETATMLFTMHIAEQLNGSIRNDERLMAELELIQEEVGRLLLSNASYWNGKVEEYYHRYKRLIEYVG